MRSSSTKFLLTKCCLGILLLLGLSWGMPTQPPTVRANAGPELQGPTMVGSVISPYQYKSTKVQMVDEQVTLRLEAVPSTSQENKPILLSQVVVTAAFHMRNTAAVTESMAAVFPLTELLCPVYAGVGAMGPIYEHELDAKSFKVAVNQQPVTTTPLNTTTLISSTFAGGPDLECKTEWRKFNVTFPPGKDVQILVNYLMKPTYFAPYAYPWDSFTYILKTGAPWHGSIKQIDLTLQLPYTPTASEILRLPTGAKQQGSTFAWQWRNAEPKANINIVVLSPQTHQEYAAAAQNIKTKPQDADAWGAWAALNARLAGRHDVGASCMVNDISAGPYMFVYVHNWDYARTAVQAYKQALTLRPKDAKLQTNYAWLLAAMSLSGNKGRIRPEFTSVRRASIELRRALVLDTDNQHHSQDFWRIFQICMDDDVQTAPCGCEE